MQNKELTGYPSIDKPWLKYYTESLEGKPLPQKTLYRMIYDANKDHKSDYAFNYFGRRITYGQLFYEIDRCAKALLRLGVKPDDIVTIMGLSAPETFYVAYACSKIGAVINLISVLAGEQELVHYLNEAKSKVFIALDLFNDKIIKALPQTGVKTVVNMSLAESMPLHIKAVYKLKAKVLKCKDFIPWKAFVALADGQPPVKVFKFVPNRFSYLAHTGGTTGEPRGVMLCDEGLNGITHEDKYIFLNDTGDTLLNTVVPFVVYGFLLNAHIPLYLGIETVLLPKVDAEKVPKIILKHHINYVSSVPLYLEYLVKDKSFIKSDLSFIKDICSGGDGMTIEFEKRLNHILLKQGVAPGHMLMNGYGLTEVSSMACGNYKRKFLGSVGYPLSRIIISAFASDTYQEMKYNEIGEICINTPYLMLGYLNNPEATAEVVKTHADGKKWFHTGDLGYITEEGAVYITGRIKRIILTEKDGMVSKIFPDRVEKLLESHKAVEVSCVVRQPGDDAEVKLTAHVVLKEQYRVNSSRVEQELRKLCDSELPEYSRPDKYVFRDSMPLTAAGKVDFRTLEKMAEEGL